jgi:8-oxo-dGTP diphosphatase
VAFEVKGDAAVRHLTASMVVFDQHTQMVLLVHHKASGVWMFPGGHVDAGEDPAAAAVREVFEETGVYPMIVGPPPIVLPGMSWLPSPWLTCEIPAPAKPDRGPGKPAEAAHKHVDMLFVGMASAAGVSRPAADEVHAVRWVTLDQLDGWAEVRAEVPMVARLARAWGVVRGHW